MVCISKRQLFSSLYMKDFGCLKAAVAFLHSLECRNCFNCMYIFMHGWMYVQMYYVQCMYIMYTCLYVCARGEEDESKRRRLQQTLEILVGTCICMCAYVLHMYVQIHACLCTIMHASHMCTCKLRIRTRVFHLLRASINPCITRIYLYMYSYSNACCTYVGVYMYVYVLICVEVGASMCTCMCVLVRMQYTGYVLCADLFQGKTGACSTATYSHSG